MSAVVGLDIGGANLKAADAAGHAENVPFPLWKHPEKLATSLGSLLARSPYGDALAVTMTGELCDCFPSKRQGVSAILDAVEIAAEGKPVRVWRNDGRFVSLTEARQSALQVAAANWLALATFVGRLASEDSGLLIDIGSTTTDVIPLQDGRPEPQGRTDPERLRSSELVYTGVRRTPLCALLPGSAAEWFATTLDVYLLLGHIPEDPGNRDTADGQLATVAAAEARLARMFCADMETSTEEQRRSVATRALKQQRTMVQSAIERVMQRLPSQPRTVVLSGSGEFLGRMAIPETAAAARVVSLTEMLGPACSTAACAHALAVLASGVA
jgi:(4-(4-[2-(gamma-L-glutamylamino)ethyl]phenoxymethyl)furan-2-yl)methanamine synthase